MHLTPPAPQPEFSRAVALDMIGPRPIERRIAATAEECAALAKRFDLVAIDRMEGVAELRRIGDRETIRVDLRFEAEVVQRCVVTLGEVRNRMSETAVVYLAPEVEPTHEVVLDPLVAEDAVEDVEPLVGNEIDLGEIMAQHLAVALDPWPRAPGVSLGDVWTPDSDETLRPLAALAAVRKKLS